MSKIFYPTEHSACPNNDEGERRTIQEKSFNEDEHWQLHALTDKILFVLDGEMEYAIGQVQSVCVSGGAILFLPAGCRVCCRFLTEMRLLIVRLNKRTQFCGHFRLEDLQQVAAGIPEITSNAQKSIFFLETNTMLSKYLDALIFYHREGLHCKYYNELKVKELLLLFRIFYLKEDLVRFFFPAITADTFFSQLVIDNFSKYNTLAQMAGAMNYTVSGFEKRFRKTFGCSPMFWRKQQKAQEAFHLISTTDMSIKQLSDKFEFNSSSAFNNFIRKHFGKTPGQIRKNA